MLVYHDIWAVVFHASGKNQRRGLARSQRIADFKLSHVLNLNSVVGFDWIDHRIHIHARRPVRSGVPTLTSGWSRSLRLDG
jgi:hypothetical protein